MLSGRFRSTINPLHFATEKSDKRLTIEDSFNMKKKLNISNKKINISFNPNVKELINNIFNVLLTDYKKEKGNKIVINDYYNYDNEERINHDYIIEKKRINNKIRELIPLVESYIRQYSNTSYLEEKKRRNNYKRTKSRLFSWTGHWSNKYLFFEHPEFLK